MRFRVPAIVGGAVGLVSAAVAAGVVRERREVHRERARIDPKSAALFGALPIDRESTLRTDDGVALHVEEVGPAGAPLTILFVHGFALNLGAFHFQRLALTETFGEKVRMVFYDQRSHGRSLRSPSMGCTISQLGRDLYGVIDAVAPTGPIILVGHSMGGMALMAFADQYPALFASKNGRPDREARICSVLMINTSSGNLRTVTLGLPNVLARLRGPVLPVVLRRAVKNADLVEKTRALGKDLAWAVTKRLSFGSEDVDPAVVAYATNMIAATRVEVVADFYPTLIEHDGHLGLMNLAGCEVVIIGAERDALTPIEHSEAIGLALPDAKLIVAPQAGHILMLENPELVNEALIELAASALAAAKPRRRVRR